MQANWPSQADWTQAREGGLSLRTSDRGNYFNGALVGSKYGITPAVLAEWLGDPKRVTSVAMRELDTATYRAIANARYWRAVSGDQLPAGLDAMLFDFAFNSGVHRAASQLQVLVGLEGEDVDGDIGPRTLDALFALLTSTRPVHWRGWRVPSIKALQRDLGVFADGIFGPRTWAAVVDHHAQLRALIYALGSAQETAYRGFRGFSENGDGWLSRLSARQARALGLLPGSITTTPTTS